jgi:putative membrane protein
MLPPWAALALALALGGTAPPPRSPGASAERLVADVASADHLARALGRLALARADAGRVQEVGRDMLVDHARLHAALAGAARAAGVAVPPAMTPEHRALVARLETLRGPAFDRAYARAVAREHRKDVARVRRATRSRIAPVAAFARSALPVLRRHLARAERLVADGPDAGAVPTGP